MLLTWSSRDIGIDPQSLECERAGSTFALPARSVSLSSQSVALSHSDIRLLLLGDEREDAEVCLRSAMSFTEEPSSQGGYAPLIGRHVACESLDVFVMRGRRPVVARSADGVPIVLPREAELVDLEDLIDEAGCYRVVARDPETRHFLTHKDHHVQPTPAASPMSARPQAPRAERAPSPVSMPTPMPYGAMSEHGYLAHLHETINNLRDQLREAATRADRDIRYERERADAGIKATHEACEAVRKQAFDANVKLSAYVARLEARDQRIDDLEAQLAEMKEEVDNARALAAELKVQAENSGFDPFDAFMQVDQALDIAAKTANRFKGD